MQLLEIIDDRSMEWARHDPKKLVESMFQIVDKSGFPVPFHLRPAQLEYYRRRSPRDDVLKARKEGFSSLILAILTVKFLFLENVNCVCISHEAESTKRLFEKVEYYIDHLTLNGEPVEVKLDSKSSSRLKFKERNNTFYIGTAGAKSFGRGDTIHYLHCSELAFWDNASKILTGLLNAVPDDLENTFIVKESTANGVGTQHHKEWVNEKKGESTFKPHFFGWHLDPDNYKEPGSKNIEWTDEEKRLAVKYNLSGGQLYWRRWKISSMQPDDTHTKEELFRQEYPISDTEAFLSSGKPIFDQDMLDYYEEVYVRDPIKVGELMGSNPVTFVENPSERLKIWAEPQKGHSYALSGDVGETHDFCYLTVIDKETCEQVAEWHGHVEEFELAAIAVRLAKYYNNALIGIERNNHGVAVVKKIDEIGYDNQYVRESIDKLTNEVHNELGWRTDSATRPIMISDFNKIVTDRTYKIRSKLVIGEMRTFVRNKNGKAEAQQDCYDDAVIGNCIAIQLYKVMPEAIKDDEVAVRDYVPNNSLYNYMKRNNLSFITLL